GVGVALVDTGVVDTPDLHGSRLVRSPDFSGEEDAVDHYGHGTFMAGLIAGDGTASAGAPDQHFGVAPGATLVSVKVADADGSSTLSRVIAGIGWVVANRDTYNIGVLNLSFGLDAPLPYVVNPLDAAAEARSGDGTASAGAPDQHFGVAPGATLVSVKVADADGSSTLSRVIAGIGWVVANRDTYNIGVLNLSFGLDAPLPYVVNPLDAAAEA